MIWYSMVVKHFTKNNNKFLFCLQYCCTRATHLNTDKRNKRNLYKIDLYMYMFIDTKLKLTNKILLDLNHKLPFKIESKKEMIWYNMVNKHLSKNSKTLHFLSWKKTTSCLQNTNKIESLKKVQHNKTESVAGSVWLILFTDVRGKW